VGAIEQIAVQAVVRRAQERLLLIGEMRDAYRLRQSGKSQREIAVILRTTQPRVGRLLRGACLLGETTTPEEIILRATVDRTSRSTLVRRLCALSYSFNDPGPVARKNPVPDTWNQVREAHLLGLLDDEEYEIVRSAVNPPNAATAATG
jgi:hypothetical protein